MTHSSTEQPSAFYFQLNNVLYCHRNSPGSGKLAQKTLLILFQRPPAWGWLFQPFQHDSRGTDNQLQAETSDTKTGTTSCGQLFLRTMTLCCFFIQSIQEWFLLSYEAYTVLTWNVSSNTSHVLLFCKLQSTLWGKLS